MPICLYHTVEMTHLKEYIIVPGRFESPDPILEYRHWMQIRLPRQRVGESRPGLKARPKAADKPRPDGSLLGDQIHRK